MKTAKPALQAWDPENSTIVYALADGFTSPHFTVSPFGTVVYKAGASLLDYETVRLYAIRVKATDASGLNVSATAFVSILDINEPPVLPNQTRTIREDALPLTALGAPLGELPCNCSC